MPRELKARFATIWLWTPESLPSNSPPSYKMQDMRVWDCENVRMWECENVRTSASEWEIWECDKRKTEGPMSICAHVHMSRWAYEIWAYEKRIISCFISCIISSIIDIIGLITYLRKKQIILWKQIINLLGKGNIVQRKSYFEANN